MAASASTGAALRFATEDLRRDRALVMATLDKDPPRSSEFRRVTSTPDPFTFEKHRNKPPISIAILLQKYALFLAESSVYQKRSGDPNPSIFRKVLPYKWGGVLPYKWEAYCSTNRRRIAGFPFLRSLEARKVRRHKWGAYCRTNWRCTTVLFRQVVGVGVSETLPNVHHQFVSRYGSHLYCDTFAKVLGSGGIGTLPKNPENFILPLFRVCERSGEGVARRDGCPKGYFGESVSSPPS